MLLPNKGLVLLIERVKNGQAWHSSSGSRMIFTDNTALPTQCHPTLPQITISPLPDHLSETKQLGIIFT